MRTIVCSYLVMAGSALMGQKDTALSLIPEVLSDTNVRVRRTEVPAQVAVTATRSLEYVEELPHTVWVFTASEIARYGFITLADVLRAVPGVRVSQPGNALEGELFLLRGLRGNGYVKVLINDVPVRPSFAPGMPIGAQLPLSQCERIEVVVGPASSTYGDGACAAVINLILRESERPVYTKADLSVGNFGFNRLDLTLGGKLLQGSKSFRFSLYGSNTVRESTDYYWDEKLFVAKHYLPFGFDTSYLSLWPNYRPRTAEDSTVRTAVIPHESRLLGMHFTWRGLRFQYHRMRRFEHSSLGLNPLVASYANPSTRIAERIETFAIGLQHTRKRVHTSHLLSAVHYSVDGSSAFAPGFDGLTTALLAVQMPASESERRQRLRRLAQRYTSEERYLVAKSIDLRLESRLHVALARQIHLDAGLQASTASGVPPMGYFRTPVAISFNGRSTPPANFPFPVSSRAFADVNVFFQGSWRTRRTFAVGGAALHTITDGKPILAPRLALRYSFDSVWAVRLAYAEGFQRPLAFRLARTYRLAENGPEDARPLLAIGLVPSQPERVRTIEAALSMRPKWFSFEVIAFYQEARHLFQNGRLNFEPSSWQYGFAQTPGLAMRLGGVQAVLKSAFFPSYRPQEEVR